MATALVVKQDHQKPPGAAMLGSGAVIPGGGIGGLQAIGSFPNNASFSGFIAAPLPLLVDALDIQDDDIRAATIKALGRHGEKATIAIPKLVALLGPALDKLEEGIAKGTPVREAIIELPYHVLDAVVGIDAAATKVVPKDALKIPEATATELKSIVPKWRKAYLALAAQHPIPPSSQDPSAAAIQAKTRRNQGGHRRGAVAGSRLLPGQINQLLAKAT